MLQARIGRLEPSLRRVLRAASVFGETFVPDGVLALFGHETPGDELARWLEDLIREEIVELRRGERLVGGQAYRFRHALMREAVYGLLTDEDRLLGHRAAAAFLAERNGEPAAVAEHYALAGDIESAGKHLETAVAHAYDKADIETAGRLAKRGLALGVQGPVRGALLAVEANHFVRVWDWQAGVDAGEEALRLVATGSVWWSRAVTAMITFYAYRNDRPAAVALASSFLDSEPLPNARLNYVDALAHVGSALTHIGSTAIGRRSLARIAEVAPDLEPFPGVAAFVTLIHCTLLRNTSDDMAAQIRTVRAAVRIFAEGGVEPLIGMLAQDNLGEVLCRAGQFEVAEQVLRAVWVTANRTTHAYARTHVATHPRGRLRAARLM